MFPEDIEGLLADHGLDQAVALDGPGLESEAVVMPPGTMPMLAPDRGGQEARSVEEDELASVEIERVVRAADAEARGPPADRCLADVART